MAGPGHSVCTGRRVRGTHHVQSHLSMQLQYNPGLCPLAQCEVARYLYVLFASGPVLHEFFFISSVIKNVDDLASACALH